MKCHIEAIVIAKVLLYTKILHIFDSKSAVIHTPVRKNAPQGIYYEQYGT